MTLTEEARELIRAHIASRPRLSIAAMARACNIPATTARSIVQGEVQTASIENITALLLSFMATGEVTKLLIKHSAENRWKGLYGVMSSPDDKGQGPVGWATDEGAQWKHPDHLILAMACLGSGVSRAWLIRKFGEVATIPRIEALLDAELVDETDGMLRIKGDFVYLNSVSGTHEMAKLHLNAWTLEQAESGGWVYHLMQNYSEKDHEAAREYARDFLQKLSALGKKKSGDRVLVFSMAASLFNGEGEK